MLVFGSSRAPLPRLPCEARFLLAAPTVWHSDHRWGAPYRRTAPAGIANADPWKTSWIALKMGLATFIVPFMFFYAPLLLMKGDWADIVQATVSAAIGVWFLASSTEG